MINSYGGYGVAKPGIKKSDHGILSSGKHIALPLPSEKPRRHEASMRPKAVLIDIDDPTNKLHPISRINYSKVYTVEHNTKVRGIGMTQRSSMQALIFQFRAVWDEQLTVNEHLEPEQHVLLSALKGRGYTKQQALDILINPTANEKHSRMPERGVAGALSSGGKKRILRGENDGARTRVANELVTETTAAYQSGKNPQLADGHSHTYPHTEGKFGATAGVDTASRQAVLPDVARYSSGPWLSLYKEISGTSGDLNSVDTSKSMLIIRTE